jgi:hypothetical protein
MENGLKQQLFSLSGKGKLRLPESRETAVLVQYQSLVRVLLSKDLKHRKIRGPEGIPSGIRMGIVYRNGVHLTFFSCA